MSMDMFKELVDALLSVTENVGHYEALNEEDKYIVWAEDGQANSVYADNVLQEQALTGTIDYFTKSEEDENVKAIQDALINAEISFKLNSIRYERETEFTHYEWVFEVT